MIVKSKKIIKNKPLRVLTGGNIEEVLFNLDLENKDKEQIDICYKGDISSGIIQLSHNEALDLHETLDNYFKKIHIETKVEEPKKKTKKKSTKKKVSKKKS